MENSSSSQKNNGRTAPRRYLAREFGSRFKSPILPSPSPETVSESDAQTLSGNDTLRTPAPERKNIPLKEHNNSADGTDNFRPTDSVNSQLLDEHRWSKASSNSRKVDGNYRSLDGSNSRVVDQECSAGGESPSSSPNKAISKGDEQSIRIPPVDDNSKTGSRPASPNKGTAQSLNNLHSQLLDRWPVRTARKVTSDRNTGFPGGVVKSRERNSRTASPLRGSRAPPSKHDAPSNTKSLFPSSQSDKGVYEFHSFDDNPFGTKGIASATTPFSGSVGSTKWIQSSSGDFKSQFPSHSVDDHQLSMQRPKTSALSSLSRGASPSRTSAASPFLGSEPPPSRRLSLDGGTKLIQSSSREMLSVDSVPIQSAKTPLLNPETRSSAPSSSLPIGVIPSKVKAIASGASRRLSSEGATKPLQKFSNDTLSVPTSSGEHAKGSFEFRSVDDNSVSLQKFSNNTRPRPISPNRASALHFSPSRVIPSQTKAIANAPSRGASPSKVRPSSPVRRPNPGFIFVADNKENDANQSEDAHQLRLLHNRLLQLQYANAKADAAKHAEEVNTKEMAYNVWSTNSNLRGTITEMKIELQQLKLELKLYSALNKQLSYLDEWSLIEKNHITSVSRASQDMQACVLCVPMMRGVRGDIEAVKSAVCSAFVLMQYVESSICSILSQLQGTSILVSELAGVVAQERAMLDEFELLMAPTADMQVEEYSLRSHLMQLGTSLKK